MPIFQGDLRLKAAITLGLEDISKNLWLIDDILADTVSNEYMRRFYATQIASCKQWITNNRIGIYLSGQQAAKQEFPSIDIELGTSNEKLDMKGMADLDYEKIRLIPNIINKPIPYVTPPPLTGTYNSTTGVFTFNGNVNLSNVSPGMIMVDPATGNGYVIQAINAANTVTLLTNLSITDVAYGILPEHRYYEARLGRTFMQENYKLTVNCMDPQTTLWLHSIAVYSLLRYRQVLLEKDGYAESIITSSPLYPNPDYSDNGQVIWSRDINLTGQVEARWFIQPHRIIENVAIGNGGGFTGGLKIISNITDTFEDLSTVNWSTLAAVAEDGDNQ